MQVATRTVLSAARYFRNSFTPVTAPPIGEVCLGCKRSRVERTMEDARVRVSHQSHCKCRLCGYRLALPSVMVNLVA